jgi:hypothetical protein
VSRVPRRQWVAGLTTGTVQIENPHPGYRFWTDDTLTAPLARELYDPKYMSFKAAYEQVLKDSGMALAFSPNYWVCKPTGEDVKLFRRQIEIGVVSHDGKLFSVEMQGYSCSLEQELKDELKDVKLSIK